MEQFDLAKIRKTKVKWTVLTMLMILTICSVYYLSFSYPKKMLGCENIAVENPPYHPLTWDLNWYQTSRNLLETIQKNPKPTWFFSFLINTTKPFGQDIAWASSCNSLHNSMVLMYVQMCTQGWPVPQLE